MKSFREWLVEKDEQKDINEDKMKFGEILVKSLEKYTKSIDKAVKAEKLFDIADDLTSLEYIIKEWHQMTRDKIGAK